MTYPVNVMQGSEIEVTEDREAVLDCVSPGGKPAPDVSVFHLDTLFAPFFVSFFAIFVSVFVYLVCLCLTRGQACTLVSPFFGPGLCLSGGKPAPDVRLFHLETNPAQLLPL